MSRRLVGLGRSRVHSRAEHPPRSEQGEEIPYAHPQPPPPHATQTHAKAPKKNPKGRNPDSPLTALMGAACSLTPLVCIWKCLSD